MTEGIIKRIDRLEIAAGGSAGCPACAEIEVRVYSDDEPTPPDRCEKCGREILIVHVQYVPTQNDGEFYAKR